MAAPKKKGQTINAAYAIGLKVRNRHTDQSGVVDSITANNAGNWYYVSTVNGMSIGYWHETDIDGSPKTSPPNEKRAG